MSWTMSDGRKAYRVRLHTGRRCALAAMILGLGTAQAFAQCVEQQKLPASDAAQNDLFGGSVSISGDTAVVGASGDDCTTGFDCGSAYVFRLVGSGWVEEQKLTASDAAADDRFGWSVSVSGDTAVVGAKWADCAAGSNCGAAYVYRFNGISWIEEQKLTASDAAAGDEFGWSVSMSGDTAVVGAWHKDCAVGIGNGCGSAYVFSFDGTAWVEKQKLTASVAAAGTLFGQSVSVSADTAVVGAVFDDYAAGDDGGSAYIYRFDGTSWIEEQKLTASDAGAVHRFGGSVSVSGDTAVVGAYRDACTADFDCGSVYVFRFNGDSWVEEQKLAASDAAADDRFGISVSVSGDTTVVGARQGDSAAVDDSGAAYVFRFNGTRWVEKHKLTASDAAPHRLFAGSVFVSGNTVVVGARWGDCAAGFDCGSAYVFSCAFGPTVVNLDIKPGGCPNPVNPHSKGVMPVAIVGSLDFDIATIDPNSLTLARADGIGESVSPLSDRRGPRIAIEDVATPLDGERCTCHELGGDGIDDLSLKFSTSEMNRALELNGLGRGETIELVLRGSLQDGTTFEGTDCIVIPGKGRDGRGLRRTDRSK